MKKIIDAKEVAAAAGAGGSSISNSGSERHNLFIDFLVFPRISLHLLSSH